MVLLTFRGCQGMAGLYLIRTYRDNLIAWGIQKLGRNKMIKRQIGKFRQISKRGNSVLVIWGILKCF